MAKGDQNKKMIQYIYEAYRKKREPGIYVNQEDLKERTLRGEPGTARRGKQRKRCRPQGPVGFLLESFFLQAAALSEGFEIRKWNQPNIQIWEAPYQHLKPMVQQMCTRNRTKDCDDTREETVGLDEIDREATEAMAKQLDPQDRNILDIVRS